MTKVTQKPVSIHPDVDENDSNASDSVNVLLSTKQHKHASSLNFFNLSGLWNSVRDNLVTNFVLLKE
jgi:hypothetical protein